MKLNTLIQSLAALLALSLAPVGQTFAAPENPKLSAGTNLSAGKTKKAAKKSAKKSSQQTTLSAAGAAVSNQVRTVDRIVAIVNRHVITQRGLNARVAQAERNLKQQNIAMPDAAILQAQVLERMILEESLMQHANSVGIKVQDRELDETLKRLAQNNRLSPAEFKQRLATQGINYAQFREDIRREMTMQQLREREVDQQITVSDNEIDAWLAQNQHTNAEYLLSHILVAVSDNANPARVEERANRMRQALAELNSGRSFAQVAAKYSDAPEALNAGNLGWVTASRLGAPILAALAAVKKGEHTQVIRTAAGFHIFQLNDQRQRAQSLEIEQIAAQHILIRVGEKLNEAEARAKIEQIAQEIAQGLPFDQAAKRYSEDGSASRGGALGWVSRGETVPEFERVLFSIEPNTVSAPVRSPFGWHLILASDKRQHSGTDPQRAEIRQELFAKKAEERYQEWQSQIRDSTYVENFLHDAS